MSWNAKVCVIERWITTALHGVRVGKNDDTRDNTLDVQYSRASGTKLARMDVQFTFGNYSVLFITTCLAQPAAGSGAEAEAEAFVGTARACKGISGRQGSKLSDQSELCCFAPCFWSLTSPTFQHVNPCNKELNSVVASCVSVFCLSRRPFEVFCF